MSVFLFAYLMPSSGRISSPSLVVSSFHPPFSYISPTLQYSHHSCRLQSPAKDTHLTSPPTHNGASPHSLHNCRHPKTIATQQQTISLLVSEKALLSAQMERYEGDAFLFLFCCLSFVVLWVPLLSIFVTTRLKPRLLLWRLLPPSVLITRSLNKASHRCRPPRRRMHTRQQAPTTRTPTRSPHEEARSPCQGRKGRTRAAGRCTKYRGVREMRYRGFANRCVFIIISPWRRLMFG